MAATLQDIHTHIKLIILWSFYQSFILTGSPISRQDSPYKGRRSRQVPQGQPGAYEDNPMQRMLAETQSQAHHAEHMIAREREYEKVQQKLFEEFSKLDLNQDGLITLEEIVEFNKIYIDSEVQYNKFLTKQAQEHGVEVDTRVAQELYAEIDTNQDGRISLQEFVESYFYNKKELNFTLLNKEKLPLQIVRIYRLREVEERIEELNKIIVEDEGKRVELQAKYREIDETEQTNQHGIMIGSVLTANVIEARELRSNKLGAPNPYVVLTIEGQRSQTDQVKTSTDPLWNEIITFDITTGREALFIQVFDRDITQLNDQYKHDEWFNLENERGDQLTGKIRLMLHWIHSRRRFLQEILKIQDLALEEEKNEREALVYQLENMKKPFGFISSYYQQEKILSGGSSIMQSEKIAQLQSQMFVKEKQFEQRLDEVTNVVAEKLGFREIPWYRVTVFLTVIYSALTVLICFYREDFLNLTVCTVAAYMLLNKERVTQNTFRYLVLGVIISIFYDLAWFSVKSYEYEGYYKNDAAVTAQERALRRFAFYASVFSFFLRLIIALVYWKDSLDYDNIMLGRKFQAPLEVNSHNLQQPSPKQRNEQVFLRDLSPQGKSRGVGNFRFQN